MPYAIDHRVDCGFSPIRVPTLPTLANAQAGAGVLAIPGDNDRRLALYIQNNSVGGVLLYLSDTQNFRTFLTILPGTVPLILDPAPRNDMWLAGDAGAVAMVYENIIMSAQREVVRGGARSIRSGQQGVS